MYNTATINMKEYYEQRKIVRKLYQDKAIYSELCSNILGYKERSKYIDSITIDFNNFMIRVHMVCQDEEYSEMVAHAVQVQNYIDELLTNFIIGKIGMVTDPETAAKIQHNQSIRQLRYYDTSFVSTNLDFSL